MFFRNVTNSNLRLNQNYSSNPHNNALNLLALSSHDPAQGTACLLSMDKRTDAALNRTTFSVSDGTQYNIT